MHLLAAVVALALHVTGGSGLRGIVVISPAYPVCQIGVPCTRPAKDLQLRFSRRGRLAARTRTGSDGSYRVSLAPGSYTVTTASATGGRGLEPRAVLVAANRYRRVNFTLDIGIR